MRSIFPVIVRENLFSFALADMLQQVTWMKSNVPPYFTTLSETLLTSLLTEVKPINCENH